MDADTEVVVFPAPQTLQVSASISTTRFRDSTLSAFICGVQFDMNRCRLYLLKPDFVDQGKGPFFCPGCAQMLGLLEHYPALKPLIEVRYVDFVRPRPELVGLLGEENQSCPVLVLSEAPVGLPPTVPVRQARGSWFVEGANEIARYLAHAHGIGQPY